MDAKVWPEWHGTYVPAAEPGVRHDHAQTVAPYVADPVTGLPWADDTFDGAVCHHVLQMVAYPDLVPFLADVRRVLKPGAPLRITVPDVLGAFAALAQRERRWFPIDHALEPGIDGAFCLYVSQAGATRSVFTEPWLRLLCERAGLFVPKVAPIVGWIYSLDSRTGESVLVDAEA